MGVFALFVLVGVLALILLAVGGALIYRKVRQWLIVAKLRVKTPNRIIERGFVTLRGKKQWVSIRGEDRANPIVLVLHGGPGFPYSPFEVLLRSWEKHFTIVQWDQWGAGKTYSKHGKKGTGEITFERIVADGIELATYLCKKLGQEKLMLLSSSAGTLVSVPMAQQRPDLFSAFIGTDFNASNPRAERAGYLLTLERMKAAGKKKAVAALEAMGADPSRWTKKEWDRKQQMLMSADPLMHNVPQTLLGHYPVIEPRTSLRQMIDVFVGFSYSQGQLFKALMANETQRFGTHFAMPFFLFNGESDILTPSNLADEYFASVAAPLKYAKRVPNAGHFLIITHPAQVLALLLEHVHPLVAAKGLPVPARG